MKKVGSLQKSILLAAMIAAAGSMAFSNPPASIQVRGALTDSNGDGATLPGTRAVRVRYFDAATNGNQLGATVNSTVEIPNDGRFAFSIVPPAEIFGAAQVFYELAIDSNTPPNGIDANDVFGTRTQVHSVPFAIQAGNAGAGAAGSLNAAYQMGATINANNGPVIINGNGLTVSGPLESGALEASSVFSYGKIVADAASAFQQTNSVEVSAGDMKTLMIVDGMDGVAGFAVSDENGNEKFVAGSFGSSNGGEVDINRANGDAGLVLSGQQDGQPAATAFYEDGKKSWEVAGRTDGAGASLMKMFNKAGTEIVRAGNGNDAQGDGHGSVTAFQTNGKIGVTMSGGVGNVGGQLGVFDNAGTQTAGINGGEGKVTAQIVQCLSGTDIAAGISSDGVVVGNYIDVYSSPSATDPTVSVDGATGTIKCLDANGDIAAGLSSDGAVAATYFDAYASASSQDPTVSIDGTSGLVQCLDANGDLAAGMSSDGVVAATSIEVYASPSAAAPIAGIDGTTGEVYGVTKNFVVEDPTNPERMIKYTSLEGPEAGIYFRGTADLANGQATVTFPEHFASLVDPSTVTVQLTPRSRISKGLATDQVNAGNFSVFELSTGTGSYKFDYLVHGVRKGFENYEVYQDKKEFAARHGNPAGQNSTKSVK